MVLFAEQILRIIASAIVGTMVGYERELKNKPAGILTFSLVSVGSCIIAILQQNLLIDYPNADPGRIIAQVVSGIGFLGAGTILYKRGSVQGISTAAMLWLMAALGLTIGTGGINNYIIAATTVVVILPILMLSRKLSNKFTQTRKVHRLRILFDDHREKELFDFFSEIGITIKKIDIISKNIEKDKYIKEIIIIFNLPPKKLMSEIIDLILHLEYVFEANKA